MQVDPLFEDGLISPVNTAIGADEVAERNDSFTETVALVPVLKAEAPRRCRSLPFVVHSHDDYALPKTSREAWLLASKEWPR